MPAPGVVKPTVMEYHSDNPNDDVIRNWLNGVVNAEVRTRRFHAAGVDVSLGDRLNRPVALDNLGLVQRARPARAGTPAVTTAEKVTCSGPRCPRRAAVPHVHADHEHHAPAPQQRDRGEDAADQRGAARLGHPVRAHDGQAAGQRRTRRCWRPCISRRVCGRNLLRLRRCGLRRAHGRPGALPRSWPSCCSARSSWRSARRAAT